MSEQFQRNTKVAGTLVHCNICTYNGNWQSILELISKKHRYSYPLTGRSLFASNWKLRNIYVSLMWLFLVNHTLLLCLYRQLFLRPYLVPKIENRHSIKTHVRRSAGKVPDIFVQFNKISDVSPYFIENPKYEIHLSPSGWNRLFHADRQRGWHDKAKSRHTILWKRLWTFCGIG